MLGMFGVSWKFSINKFPCVFWCTWLSHGGKGVTGKDKNQYTKLFGSVLGFTNAQESDPMILGPRLFLEILSVIPLLQIIPLPLHPTIRSSRPSHIYQEQP